MTFLALTMMEDDALRKAFAVRLKELRKQKGLTQKGLAQRVESAVLPVGKGSAKRAPVRT